MRNVDLIYRVCTYDTRTAKFHRECYHSQRAYNIDAHTAKKAQEEEDSDASDWGAEAAVEEEDREERLVRELTDILGQNKASRKR